MVNVTHAALHILDTDEGVCTISDRELDLSVRTRRSYVQRLVRQMSSSPDNKRGSLSADSAFGSELSRYLSGQRSFLDLSADIARTIWECLRMSEDARPSDLIVADFIDTDSRMSTKKDEESKDEEPSPDDFEDSGHRLFAVAVLGRRRSYVHELVESSDGRSATSLASIDAVLPNPTQKLSIYAVIDCATMEVELQEADVLVGGQSMQLMSDVVLGCAVSASAHEVVNEVARIAGELADESGKSAAVMMADAKDYMSHSVQQSASITPSEVGEHIFADDPGLAGRFLEQVQTASLPQQVTMRPSVANRLAKNHRIRTDTGIDITFPSAYAADAHYIEFSRDQEGGVEITIHAARIENR